MAYGFKDFFYSRLTVRRYALCTQKVRKLVRLALVTDLHCCLYGEGQSELLEAIKGLGPHAVVMSGDIIDNRYPPHNTNLLFHGLRPEYPVFYVIGNHEVRTGRINLIKKKFAGYNVKTLAGEHVRFSTAGQQINICGVDDPEAGERRFKRQLDAAFRGIDNQYYTVLLSHRPERFLQYAKYPCDLVLAGHAHGGQWRLPPMLNGLYAPNQGLFPKLAGGYYETNGTGMIVSRGLARESTPLVPRIFNPPELVSIDILPE